MTFVASAAPKPLSAASATVIASVCTAAAVLVVGVLNVWSQRRQRIDQSRLLERQLAEQRRQVDDQLAAQREQSANELRDQRQLRILEMREAAAHIVRSEKSAAYTRALLMIREERAAWQRMATLAPHLLIHELAALQQRITQVGQNASQNTAEVELIASQPVYEALLQFQEKTVGLLDAFIVESERLIAVAGEPTVETLAGAQAALAAELDRRNLYATYGDLLRSMRSELFDLALDEPLRPALEDQGALRQEVARAVADLNAEANASKVGTTGPKNGGTQ